MKLKPLHDNIIVKQFEEEKVTKSGIIIPDTSKGERPQQGEIIAVGKGRINEQGELKQLEVKVGDKILFSKYSPTEIKIDNEEYLVMKESDVLAIIE